MKNTDGKTLVLFRHSLRSGPGGTIDQRGLDLASLLGKFLNSGFADDPVAQSRFGGGGEEIGGQRRFNRQFLGPQSYNLQTGAGLCFGLGYTPRPMPVVIDFGDEVTMGQITTPQFCGTLKSKSSLLMAILDIHGRGRAESWSELYRTTLMSMFRAMEIGENAVGFFNGIPIVLAALACGAEKSGVVGWGNLSEMEGLIFSANAEGVPAVTGKIGIQVDASGNAVPIYISNGTQGAVFAADATGKTVWQKFGEGEGLVFAEANKKPLRPFPG